MCCAIFIVSYVFLLESFILLLSSEETLFNLPILALSRLSNIPFKEAAMTLVLFDDNHTGISSNLLYSYLSETYETKNKSYSGKERNYNLYIFLTSDETEKSKFM